MATIKNVKISTDELELSPREMAHIFSLQDENYQAMFFSHLADLFSHWEKPYEFQLESVSQSPVLSKEGREVMSKIGDYSGK